MYETRSGPARLRSWTWKDGISDIVSWVDRYDPGHADVVNLWAQSNPVDERAFKLAQDVKASLTNVWISRLTDVHAELVHDRRSREFIAAELLMVLAARFAPEGVTEQELASLELPFDKIKKLVSTLEERPSFDRFARVLAGGWQGSWEELVAVATMTGCELEKAAALTVC